MRLQVCFRSWKKCDSKSINLPTSTFRADCELAISAEKYRMASLRVCHAVRTDDRRFFDDLAEQTGSVASQGFHRIWDAIKPLLPRAKNKTQKQHPVALARQLNNKPHISVVSRQVMKLTMPAC